MLRDHRKFCSGLPDLGIYLLVYYRATSTRHLPTDRQSQSNIEVDLYPEL